MTEGTSRGPTKTVRFPAGSDLPAWYASHAEATGVSENALIVLALTKYRDETNGTDQESKRDDDWTPDATQT